MRFDSLARWSPQVLSILRIIAALLFLQFGMAKILGFPYVEMFQGISYYRSMAFPACSSWSAAFCC